MANRTARTQKELREALGLKSKGYVSGLVKRDWFPAGPPWDVAECERVLAENLTRRRSEPSGEPAPAPSEPRAPATTYPAELLDALEADELEPVEAARLALKLARLDLAAAGRRGSIPKAKLEALKNALVELRTAEEAMQASARSRGELIPAEEVAAAAGAVGRRFVRGLDGVQALLATQVEIWLGDPAHRKLTAQARRRVVEDWYRHKTRELRAELAEEWEV